jgi:hypothetical protein
MINYTQVQMPRNVAMGWTPIGGFVPPTIPRAKPYTVYETVIDSLLGNGFLKDIESWVADARITLQVEPQVYNQSPRVQASQTRMQLYPVRSQLKYPRLNTEQLRR